MSEDIALEIARFANELEIIKIFAVLIFMLGFANIVAMWAMLRNNRRDDERLTSVIESNLTLNVKLVEGLTTGLSSVHDRITSVQKGLTIILEHYEHQINGGETNDRE